MRDYVQLRFIGNARHILQFGTTKTYTELQLLLMCRPVDK